MRHPLLALLPIAPAVVLAGCVPAARPPLPPAAPPAPVATPAPAPVLGTDWRDWPATPGDWRYRRDARGSVATFGTGEAAVLTLRCDAQGRQVQLARTGGEPAPVTIRTSTATRTLAVQPVAAQPPQVAATLAATDPLLDAIAFSRGRFVVAQPGLAPLVVPAWPEIGRVIEDCRG